MTLCQYRRQAEVSLSLDATDPTRIIISSIASVQRHRRRPIRPGSSASNHQIWPHGVMISLPHQGIHRLDCQRLPLVGRGVVRPAKHVSWGGRRQRQPSPDQPVGFLGFAAGPFQDSDDSDYHRAPPELIRKAAIENKVAEARAMVPALQLASVGAGRRGGESARHPRVAVIAVISDRRGGG